MKMIACVDKKTLAIGNDGDLIFRCKEDMAFFKSRTMGKIIVMGSKTYASMGGALKGRLNIVLTNHPELYVERNDAIFLSLHQLLNVLEIMRNTDNVVVIGGGEIYKLLINYCDTVYLTRVYRNSNIPIKYDSEFPVSIRDTKIWRKIYYPSKNVTKPYMWADEDGAEHTDLITFKFFTYKRIKK